MAAFLAKDGFQGPTHILEAADGGFCRATSDAVDLTLVTEQLGERFHAAEVNIKPYACCASSHSAVDAVLALKREHGFSAAEVEAACVETAKGVQVQCGFDYHPAGAVQAQMSLQYIVAVTLIDGAALPAQFAESRLADPALLDLARRVRIEVDPEIDRLYPARYANRVVITLKDGRCVAARVDHARGSTERPLALIDVAEKFCRLSTGSLSHDQAQRVIDAVEGLDRAETISDFTRLLA